VRLSQCTGEMVARRLSTISNGWKNAENWNRSGSGRQRISTKEKSGIVIPRLTTRKLQRCNPFQILPPDMKDDPLGEVFWFWVQAIGLVVGTGLMVMSIARVVH
jgi:hypothetical protein